MALPKYFSGLTYILSFNGSALLIMPALETMHGLEAFGVIALRFLFSIFAVLPQCGCGGVFPQPLAPLRAMTVICGILLFYPNTVMNILAAVAAIAVLARCRLEISREAVAEAMANEAVIK